MNADEYKSRVNQREALDHTTLNVTLKELISRKDLELAGQIRRILEKNSITKPEMHLKPFDNSTTYYKVYLSQSEIGKIVDMFFELEANHAGENGETTPTASFYASLVDRWNHLL